MFQYRIGDMRAPALNDHEALLALVTDFASCIRNGGTPRTDSWQGVRVLELLEAVDRSQAQRGALVELA